MWSLLQLTAWNEFLCMFESLTDNYVISGIAFYYTQDEVRSVLQCNHSFLIPIGGNDPFIAIETTTD